MTLPNTEEYYQKLAEKWLTGMITAQEKEEFTVWYNANQDAPVQIPPGLALNDKEIHDRILFKIKTEIHTVGQSKSTKLSYFIIAACLALIFVSFFIYFLEQKPTSQSFAEATNEIPPGGNKATLTLSNGSVINLDDVNKGRIVEDDGAHIVKAADGLLAYTADPKISGDKISKFNTVSTPNGGQYRIILPDGTKVWLNAASALVYPTIFSGEDRRVKLSGEAYFEVAKIKGKSFKVSTASQEITVLGTHFNIKAYLDEPQVKTTLVEGAVKVTPFKENGLSLGRSVLLKPGEQSLLAGAHRLTVHKVNVTNEVAWKSGIFSFHNTDIRVVAREFSRWYDVSIDFEGELPDVKLWGEMDRNVNATEALEILHYFKLKYRIVNQGSVKKIIISK